MKPEPIHEIANVDQRASNLLLCILFISLTTFMTFKSLLLTPIFMLITALPIIAYRKSKYILTHTITGNRICKIYSSNKKECINLQSNGALHLRSSYQYGKYTVSASNEITTLNLFETGNYKKAKAIAEK